MKFPLVFQNIVPNKKSKPTDDYQKELSNLKENNWFRKAIKVAVAIGEDANKETLAKFTGNSEAVITVRTPEELKKWIRKVSITSSQIGSKSQPAFDGKILSKQDAMIDEIKTLTVPTV